MLWMKAERTSREKKADKATPSIPTMWLSKAQVLKNWKSISWLKPFKRIYYKVGKHDENIKKLKKANHDLRKRTKVLKLILSLFYSCHVILNSYCLDKFVIVEYKCTFSFYIVWNTSIYCFVYLTNYRLVGKYFIQVCQIFTSIASPISVFETQK